MKGIGGKLPGLQHLWNPLQGMVTLFLQSFHQKFSLSFFVIISETKVTKFQLHISLILFSTKLCFQFQKNDLLSKILDYFNGIARLC